ncbi:hypothetical protein ACQP0C_41010 [Nocardia sp. CA-129566]|uniref:hypothetical protein n=1 Tax=Nocardia sp. CA-129566 TaxID=3239976 RepID=UPI003D9A0441
MQDAQTPQQALDIAAATTRQAHQAAALPSWVAVATGVFGGLGIAMLTMAGDYDMLGVIGWIAGIASLTVYSVLVWWLRRARRARGILPVPTKEWKQATVGLLVIVVVPMLGHANSGLYLGMSLLCGVIMGVWSWYEVARPWTTPWQN